MESDPNLINDPDRQIEQTIFKQGQDYAERNARSKEENKGRAESREKIKSLGMDPNAYATAIRLIKDKTPRELEDWKRDFEITLKVMGGRQKELFPDEQLRAEKRAEAKAAKVGPRSKADLDAQTDTNPKSDPANGGAGAEPTLEDAIAAATAKEAAEGAAVLSQVPGKKSQSATAAAKRAGAGLPN